MTHDDQLLLDGPAIAVALGRHPDQIRRWASDGLITRRGRDRNGRTLYDYDEVEAVALSKPTRTRARVSALPSDNGV
ncbi:hypothetical protein ACSMXN_09320 [Jatrophihabitans sp. DSM 45814]